MAGANGPEEPRFRAGRFMGNASTPGPPWEPPWDVTSADTHAVVQRLVRQLSRHGTEDAEDLLQEALVRLWTEERIHPGHTPGWYLRNCRFHLHNQLRRGRSLGSPRHDRSEPLAGDTETAGGRTAGAGAGSAGGDDGVLSEAAAYDLQAELAAVLDPQEREVLRLLLEGRSTRDAALRLGCSHTAVIHARHRIARRARELGAEPRDAR